MPTRIPPIDIEIAQGFLPYTDLNLQGDPARNLRIPNDVILALAGIFGIEGGNIPRMAQMSPTGALFVSEAGGGTNDYDGGQFTLAANANVNALFAEEGNPILIRCNTGDIICTTIKPTSNLGANMHVPAGFQVLLPYTASEINVLDVSGTGSTFDIYAFFHNKSILSPAM